MASLPAHVERPLAALMTGDERVARHHCVDDVTCHVGGRHPFTGAYCGVAQIVAVLRRMDEVGGERSFDVTNVMSDDSGSQVLVEGVVAHGSYARHTIIRMRYDAGRVAELWIKPLDQRREDDFWRGLMPQQRGHTESPTGAWSGNGR